MSNELRFDDRVVIVTGAGNGLGRSHALAFAKRGARVVVNDLGGDPHGSGKGNAAADKVVAEIKEAGGEAVANYDSVVEGDRIVQAALDHYKRVDIIVNNAGILRDVSFHKMTDEDWDLVYQVHVKGSYKVTHAAWSHLRDQQFGRVLFTASAAGLYGNFGQANYSMAKLGLLGLAKTLAVEGKKRNILVNTIAPVAGSRLTETIMPKEIVEQLKPEFVSPLVIKLCHEDSAETGGIYEVGAGWIASLRWQRTKGHAFKLNHAFTAEDIEHNWGRITDYSGATNPDEVNSALTPIMENLSSVNAKGGNDLIDVDAALGYEFPEVQNSYDEKDLALYALGIGAATDPLDENDLRFVYENYGKGFEAFPTYGVIPALNAMMQNPQAPGMNYGFDRILHGEQYLELKRPLPRRAQLTHKSKISEIWDKGKNAVVVTQTHTFDETGEELCVNRLTTVVRGAGGWGGDRGPSGDANAAPDRKPDAVIEQKINPNQALLYRLTGDINPLHADPQMAKAVGFDRPILHGLCTFGHAAHHVLKQYANGEVGRFKSIQVRFADVVFPGDTLITEMWKESDQRILFRCRVKERDTEVIKHAALELYKEVPAVKGKPTAKKAAAPAQPSQPAAAGASAPAESGSGQIFAMIQQYVAGHPELVSQVGAVFQFNFSDPESHWYIDLKAGLGEVQEGTAGSADATLELTDADFVALAMGKEKAQQLYFAGRLKLQGNIMLAQKLDFLQKIRSESPDSERPAETANGSATETSAESAESHAGEILDGVATKFAKGIYQFLVTEPDSAWHVDATSKKPKITEGRTDKANVTLELTEADLAALADGSAKPQELFQKGRLKVDGDMSLAHNLEALGG